jgi:hypothetical protein
MRLLRTMLLGGLAATLAACDAPEVPAQPTWADVEPILRGNCTHCHGATAARDASGFRFDLFELSDSVCGDAAKAMPAESMAHGLAPLIASAVTPGMGGRARMPPAPAPALEDWQRETILRWADAPTLGQPPRNDRRPQLRFGADASFAADQALELTVLVDDPDGESVVGVIEIGDQTLQLDGPGSFRLHLDTSMWAPASYPAHAVLCDGWDQVSYTLPDVVVAH